VIPVPPGKNPNRPDWQKERWGLEDVPEQWNNGQGVGILWGQPSGGLVDVDLDWREAFVAALHILPQTRTFGRPGAKRSHWIYRPTGKLPKTKRYKVGGKGKERSVVELLSTGAQSLVPPSRWTSDEDEDEEQRVWYDVQPATEIDGEELFDDVADVATASLLARNWPGEGSRKDYCMAAAGYLGRRLSRERVLPIIEAAIEAAGDEEASSRIRDVEDTLDAVEEDREVTGGPTLDGLATMEVTKILNRWHKWSSKSPLTTSSQAKTTSQGNDEEEGKPTDDELRDRFIERHPDYCFGLGGWRRYEGGIWTLANEHKVKDQVVRILEAAKEEKVKPNKALMASVTELAKVRLAVDDDLWDANTNILVCANGTLNLETRECMPHAPEHFATAAVPYAYDEEAQSDVWEQRVMGELIAQNLGAEATEFFREFAGYCLTTDTSHEVALWLTGRHGGGRSTILAGLEAMLGPRAGVLSLSDIERSSFALTNLPGKTLVTATEQPGTFLRGGGVLNAIISGEPIQVDVKFKDPIRLVPRCKVAWAMNETPRVGNMDDGIFRRVKLLEIPEIPPEERDPQVKEQVKNSGAAILNWALQGLDNLRERGHFKIPKSIQESTNEWHETNDIVKAFVDEECKTGPDFWESGGKLYREYSLWAKEHGHIPLGSTTIGKEWRRLGFKKVRVAKGARWHGVKLDSMLSDYVPSSK
jgi:P4 family phage/plasmid primase-like protien